MYHCIKENEEFIIKKEFIIQMSSSRYIHINIDLHRIYHIDLKEPITLIADPTLLAVEYSPLLPTFSSYVDAAASASALMPILAMHQHGQRR